LIAVICLAVGILIGQVIPTVVKNGSGLGDHSQTLEIKNLAIEHLIKETRDFAPGSEVDFVFETIDRQPDGKIMLVGLCRLVSPKPGGINGGRFWVEVVPNGKDSGYNVRNISCKYGVTEDGSPWSK